ncbi:MAG: glycosyltransferase family 2 protein [Anaerolineae bacterium]|nr:glycosyltransferase family 2 protein [Anaerolineae bacterium]
MALIMILVTCVLIVFALTAILNTLVFPRLNRTQPASQASQPFVSILIPARNEATVIERTVRDLLAQTYPHFEVLLLDDQSTDGTAALALAAGAGDARLRVLSGSVLPEGWLGKNWACHQLSQAASGELLVFTDADVMWSPDALAKLVAHMQATRANLLTIWPTQQTETWTERLVVPLMALAIFAYLPLPLVHHRRWPVFAAANGQCLVFRHHAYMQVGGHAAVRDHIVEDVAFARRIKAQGLRLRMADGAGEIACRMYHNWDEVRAGFAKNILAGHGNSLPFLAFSTLFHWLVFVAPWGWLVLGGGLWALLLVILGVGTRMLSAAATGQRLRDACWMPVSVLLMTMIAAQSAWWQVRYGGPRWKGRMIGKTRPPISLPRQRSTERQNA